MNYPSVTTRLLHACERRIARNFDCRWFELPAGTPLVSFTFDDFPRSALLNAGAILESIGVGGTFYASLGSSGRTTESGEQFHEEDIAALLAAGHELGCHTFDHLHAWDTPADAFEASVLRNARALRALAPSEEFLTHAYPISYPRPATKHRLTSYFAACRGGGQSFNVGAIDLNHLNAFFIEQSRDNFSAIRRIIDANALAGGWLIFATHDVAPSPTRYGCTPELFDRIVRACLATNSAIMPVSDALHAIGAPVEHPLIAA